MSYPGLDSAGNLKDQASLIKHLGYYFVCRYYNVNSPSKNLNSDEADELSFNDLYIVPVWENGYPTSVSYFSKSKGKSDAQNAINYAKNTIMQPLNTPIYFAVDYDATDSDISNAILPYFNGISDAMDAADDPYYIGVYGSGAVCSYIYKNVARVYYTWLSKSTKWRGYDIFTTWDIKQGDSFFFNNIPCDKDDSIYSNGTGFKL